MRLPDLDAFGIPIVGESTVGPAEFDVTLAGQLTQYLVQNRTSWAFHQLNFVATDTTTTLSWHVPDYINMSGLFRKSESVFLESIEGHAVPEPSTCVLSFLGAALLYSRRYHRLPGPIGRKN